MFSLCKDDSLFAQPPASQETLNAQQLLQIHLSDICSDYEFDPGTMDTRASTTHQSSKSDGSTPQETEVTALEKICYEVTNSEPSAEEAYAGSFSSFMNGLGRWMEDQESSFCMVCEKSFSFFRRRHVSLIEGNER